MVDFLGGGSEWESETDHENRMYTSLSFFSSLYCFSDRTESGNLSLRPVSWRRCEIDQKGKFVFCRSKTSQRVRMIIVF
jgi:hypothetical protein